MRGQGIGNSISVNGVQKEKVVIKHLCVGFQCTFKFSFLMYSLFY